MAGVNYSINVASGTTRIYGGRTGLPTWTDIAVGDVAAIPATTTIRSLEPSPAPLGTGGIDTIVSKWCGGAVGVINGELSYVIHGGGHSDYAGNQIVYMPLNAESPAWQTLVETTTNANIVADAMYHLDGKPNISHTRCQLAILDGVFWKVWQGGVYITAPGSDNVNSYDPLTGWAVSGVHTDVPLTSGSARRGAIVADIGRSVLWCVRDGTAAKLSSYDPGTDTHTVYSSTYTINPEVNAAISISRDELLAYSDSVYLLFDLSTPNTNPASLTTTGSPPLTRMGLLWDEGRSKWVAMGSTRNQVHELDPTTLVWSTRTFTGTYDIAPDDANGAYSRFCYVPEYGGYVYLADVDNATHFYRSH